jgi:hypothetical protein
LLSKGLDGLLVSPDVGKTSEGWEVIHTETTETTETTFERLSMGKVSHGKLSFFGVNDANCTNEPFRSCKKKSEDFPVLRHRYSRRWLSVVSVVSVWITLTTPQTASAQRQPPKPVSPAIEARVDAIISDVSAIHGAIGFTVPVGTYLRSGIDAGIGASSEGISGRIDLVNRFHLDPFRESKWAPYGGGGLTARFDDNRREKIYLLIFAGIDGPVKRGLTTSFEAGLGGGGRVGLIIRRAAAERR